MRNRLAWILGLVMLLVIAERPAQAYIDPGTASYMFQVVAGASLMLGWQVFYAALGLAMFTVAATVMLLDFWSMSGPEREGALSAALANMAIVGGLMIAAAAAF